MTEAASTGPMVLKNVRLAFTQRLWRAESPEAGKPGSFGCTIILQKDDPQVAAIKKRMAEVRAAKWGANPPPNIKYCLRDGAEKEHLAGFGPDTVFFNANSKTRIGIFDKDGKTPLTEADGKPYSGCFANVMIDFWAQNPADPTWGKKINAGISGVQFAGDGEAFAGGTAPAAPGSFDPLDDSDAPATTGFGQVDADDPLAV